MSASEPVPSAQATLATQDDAAAAVEPSVLAAEKQTQDDAAAAAAAGQIPAPQQIPGPQQIMTGQNTGIGSVDAINTQIALEEKEAKDKEDAKNKIKAEIQKLNDDTEKEIDELDLQKKVDGITPEEIKKISVKQKAIIDNLFEKLEEYHNKLSGGNIPFPIKFGLGTLKFVKDYFGEKIEKVELGTEVTRIELNIVKILDEEIENMKKNGGPANPMYLQQLVDLLVSLKKQIQSKPAGEAAAGLPPIPPGLDPEAPGKLPPEAPEAPGKLPPEALVPEAAALVPEAAALAVAAGGGQGGGGISHKRGHPKYINQISENRNKIFKKELEIINSIRHFHRSHTIRKRDKINSILGLRKSRNNRNRNHGNTRRHRHEHQHKHRHNNHKHKSAKHIKK
jgi:hypothetical protein